MRLKDLVLRLPAITRAPGPLVRDLGEAFELEPLAVSRYVEPSLTELDWPTGSRVLLVEAPGAVGKSAAAAMLARELRWPLVRAEKTRVAAHSLSGLVTDALGFTTDYVQRVASHTAGLVVDSLDEAHLRGGSENFLAFLENIKSLTAGGKPHSGPALILFSRADTAELIRLYFEDESVPIARLRLDFFGYAEACAFIESYLRNRFDATSRPEYNVALASPKPFAQLRDQRLRQIAAVILGSEEADLKANWTRMDDFVGYAPVLVAIAETLAVRNPMAEHNQLQSTNPTSLLLEIVNSILTREQEKVRRLIATQLAAKLPASSTTEVEPESLYSTSEQLARLVSWLAGSPMRVDLPANLPIEVRDVYEDLISNFLPDHPFIRGHQFTSAVFSDFVTANAHLSPSIKVGLSVPPPAEVGPFFARFLHNLVSEGQSGVPEHLTELIIDSWSQESEVYKSLSSHSYLSIHGDSGHINCTRETDGNDVEELIFHLDELTGAIQLGSILKNVTVVTDESVMLGTPGAHLTLGPDVVIVCSELVLDGEFLRIETVPHADSGAILAVDALSAERLKAVEGARNSFTVYCEDTDLPHHLRPYVRTLRVNHKNTVSYQRYIDLRSILTSFRASTLADLAVSADKLEQAIVKQNPFRQKILSFLETEGVVKKSGPLYTLSLNALGAFGITLVDLKRGPNDPVLNFLVRCGCSTTAQS